LKFHHECAQTDLHAFGILTHKLLVGCSPDETDASLIKYAKGTNMEGEPDFGVPGHAISYHSKEFIRAALSKVIACLKATSVYCSVFHSMRWIGMIEIRVSSPACPSLYLIIAIIQDPQRRPIVSALMKMPWIQPYLTADLKLQIIHESKDANSKGNSSNSERPKAVKKQFLCRQLLLRAMKKCLFL
jgi:hypothetical protein